MSAVTGHLETGPVIIVERDAALGAVKVRSDARPLEASHTNLMRTHWVRSALAQALQGVKMHHEWDGKRFRIVLDTPISKDVIPWARGSQDVEHVSVWGLDNAKMQCPVFDLPSGSYEAYGTCPGAREGQSITATRQVVAGELPGGGKGPPVNLPATICQSCYAEAGNLAMTDNQTRMLVRFIWTLEMVNNHYDDFVRLMSESLLALPESDFSSAAPEGILPVRLHASGDFFSVKYARAWVDIANALATHPKGHRIRFWAPTRTWAAPGWTGFWEQELQRLKVLNLVVRPSAFHFDDPAPEDFLPGSGRGSTSMHIAKADIEREMRRENFHAQGKEKLFFDWRCPVYSIRGEAVKGTGCPDVPSPDGTRHCRACWTRPDLRIDYPAH